VIFVACPGSSTPKLDAAMDRPSVRDVARGDAIRRVDLPSEPGAPCPTGTCADHFICMGGVCLSTCEELACNDKAPGCTEQEVCRRATSFASVCLPATVAYLEACGGDNQRCEAGTICAFVTGKGPICLKLCKYGCPSGATCRKASDNCDYCHE
jgi:hypothetical protein